MYERLYQKHDTEIFSKIPTDYQYRPVTSCEISCQDKRTEYQCLLGCKAAGVENK
jgi:hypothetical protein